MEMGNGGNGKREMKKWAFSFITACPLCIQQHQFWSGLLPQRRGSRDYSICISLIHTQKSIIDRPEYCGCVTSHRTGRAEFVCGLDRDKLVEQLF